jgi:SEC-C motif
MRLPADKVQKAILHADQDVRGAAVCYFANSFSSDPTIMPLVIQAIEKFGFDNGFQTHSFMEDLVQTEETVRWLIQQLSKLGQPANEKEAEPVLAYISALVHADPAVLKNHEAEIMALEFDYESKEAITERIWFRSRPAEKLWEDFEEFCQTHEDEESISDEDFDFGCRVVESLGRRQDQYADKVLEIIGGETDEIGTWKEGLAIRLAGEMKLEAAIPLMMTTLHEPPDEWISQECHRAFTKIGSEAVVAQFANDYATSDWFERISIACTLEDIHSDEAVQACLEFLNLEEDQVIKGLLLQSILFNFATEGIEPSRQFILKTPLDPDVLEVRSTLLTACKLIGERFPEFDAWLEDSKNDQEFRRKWHEDHPVPDEDENDFDDEDFEQDEYEEPEPPPITIVRRNERVGRYDPCPCGSGKKFKKCCYGKNQGGKEETDPYHAAAMSGVVPGKSTAKYPIGTVALYGPNDEITTKIVAGVIKWDGADPILERWMGTNIKDSPKVKRQMQTFFQTHGVKSVVATDRNIGCPHEEGQDFPHGEDCPFCPFWKGKQGSGADMI